MRDKNASEEKSRSNEAEQTIEAIHHGTVDALVVQGPEGPHIVMLQSSDEPYRTLVERMSDGALTLGPDNRILYANRRLAELAGEPAESLIGRNFQSLFTDYPGSSSSEVATRETSIRRHGEVLPVSVWMSPIIVGELAAKLVTVTDLSVQHRVAEVLTAERFARSILEQATDAVLVLAPNGRITHASLIAERLALAAPVGRLVSDVLPIEVQKEPGTAKSARFSREGLNILLATRPFHGVEVRLDHPSRSHRSFLLSAGPLLDDDRVAIGAIVTLTEITERKRAEEKQLMLVAELNHRVKNILAVVQAVASQTVRASDSLGAFKSTFAGRVKALSIAHDLLTRTRWIGIGLSDLIEGVLAPYQTSRVRTDGPPVLLPARAVVPLSMALHELATNASKYGALSNSAGTVSVSWSVTHDDKSTVEVEWRERGGPPIADGSSRAGFGTTLIQRVVNHDLEGHADLCAAPEGMIATMSFPIDSHAGLNDLAGVTEH